MTRALPVVLALLLSVLRPPAHAATASDWRATFPAQAVATHLGDAPARYLVVPAGETSPELTRAEGALAAALRASGRAPLVMSAQALGPVAQLGDAEIVRRGAGFPVDRVVVLRLFPNASGALTQAVVVVYDTAGRTLSTFSAAAGTALAARSEATGAPVAAATPEPAPAAAPEPPPAAEAVPDSAAVSAEPAAPATPPADAAPARPALPHAEAMEQYALRHIAFDNLVAVRAYTGTVVSRWTIPYEGKFKKSLEGKAFYEKLGRRDLVKAYESKVALKAAIGVLGGATVVGGGILAVTAITRSDEPCDAFSPSFDACFERNQQAFGSSMKRAGLGIGLAGAGAGLLGVALLINPHPVKASEARELADGYNQKLKAELGLSDEKKDAPAPAFPTLQARLSADVGPTGAGLVLSGTF